MKTRLLVLVALIIAVFLLVAVVYPTMNYRTWGNNELFYTPFTPETKIVCDEWLWQPPQNCRAEYIVTDTESESQPSQNISESSVLGFTNGVTEIINPKHGKLTYYTTLQVIDDEYLGNTVEEWQHAPHYELELQHETVSDHNFYENLGRLLMKNEMIYQMQMLGIENADDDFEVLSGGMLTSLPPHIGYSSIIHATDGHYYWLQGGTHANQVNYYKTTQLQYPDESKFPKIKTTPNLSDNDKITRTIITEVGGNDLKAEPYSVILSQPGAVESYNETPEKLTVYLNEEVLNQMCNAPTGI